MESVDIKRVQARLLEMGVAITQILEKHDISYQIAFGTLLGAVRHGGFIPWDDDFDLFLFDDRYDTAIEILRNELPGDMFVEDEKSEPNYFHGWAHVKDMNSEVYCEQFPQDNLYVHKGLCVDLYRIKRMDVKEFSDFRVKAGMEYINRRKRHNLITEKEYYERQKIFEQRKEHDSLAFVQDGEILAYPSGKGFQIIGDVFPLKKYKFENYYFLGPINYENILRRQYGDYMKLPPVEDRIPHYSFVTFN